MFLEKNFPRFNKRVKLYDSEMDKVVISDLNIAIQGKTNLAFFFETIDKEIIFGAYYSIKFPKIPLGDYNPQHPKAIIYDNIMDPKSCIFNVKREKICEAIAEEKLHLSVNQNFYFRFGSFGGGINLRKDGVISVGKKAESFDGDTSFRFKPRSETECKRLSVFQLKRN